VNVVDQGQRRTGRSRSGTRRPWLWRPLLAAAVLFGLTTAGARVLSPQAQQGQTQAAEYSAEVSKTIVELQQFRQTNSIRIRSREGKEGIATLINLNPATNAWYVLTLEWRDSAAAATYHLENPSPATRRLLLDEGHPSGLWIEEARNRYACDLFGSPLDQARNSGSIYSPLCDSRVYLRNTAAGHRTTVEAAADFLRNQVWGGEKVIVLFHHLMGDLNRETGGIRPERQVPLPIRAPDTRPVMFHSGP